MAWDWMWLANGMQFGFGVVTSLGLGIALLDWVIRKFGKLPV